MNDIQRSKYKNGCGLTYRKHRHQMRADNGKTRRAVKGDMI